ncbi:MAG: tetratricopeptide repeat protein [Marinoscillum sp.]
MKRVILLLTVVLFGCESDEMRRDRFFLQGNESLSNKQYKVAIDFYTKVLNIDQSFARAYNNRGVAYMESDHAYEAIQDYNMAIAIDQDYIGALFNRAYAYEDVGRLEDALADVETVKLTFPDSAYVYFYQGLLESKMRLYDQSATSFKKALAYEPNNIDGKINLATLYYFQDKLDTAKSLLTEVMKDNPQNASALNTLSQVYLTEGDFQNALVTINRALNIQPDDPYFLNNRGEVYLQMGEYETGLEDVNKSILLDPDNLWAYRNKGIYNLKTGNVDEAIRLLKRAVSKVELVEQVHAYLGEAYQMKGEKQLACEEWAVGVSKKEPRSQALLNQYCN